MWHNCDCAGSPSLLTEPALSHLRLRHSLPTLTLVAAGIAHVPSNVHVNTEVKDATSIRAPDFPVGVPAWILLPSMMLEASRRDAGQAA